MRILYISSGYTRIYRYLDHSIAFALRETQETVKTIPPSLKLNEFKKIIESFQPDLVFSLLAIRLTKQMLQYLHSLPLPFIVWLTEDPYYFDDTINIVAKVDYAFTIDVGALYAYKDLGFRNVYHMPLGTNPMIFTEKESNEKYSSDLCMIGYPYDTRVELMTHLLEETPYHIKIVGAGWKKRLNQSIRLNCEVIDRWIHPVKVAEYYSNAKIVINTHRPYNDSSNRNKHMVKNKSINNRTFDIAACNSFQLIEEMDDISKHFLVNEEIISFNHSQDLLQKTERFINSPSERYKIATRAKKKTLQLHTFQSRVQSILAIITGNTK